MSITTVRGTAVDCHICRTTEVQTTEHAAHYYARLHADSHQSIRPAHAPAATIPAFVQQSFAPAAPTAYKTTINHTPHIILDLLTCGGWLFVHIPLAILGGRKTKAIR